MIPHCIMYEGICILYFPELAGLPVAVVGRNSYYLLFIAVALGDHGLSIELTLTTPHHTTPHHHQDTQHSSDLLLLQESVLCLQFETKRKQWGGDNGSQGDGITYSAPASDKENTTKSFQPADEGGVRDVSGVRGVRDVRHVRHMFEGDVRGVRLHLTEMWKCGIVRLK